jgi:large subunit ribosomal protein L1
MRLSKRSRTIQQRLPEGGRSYPIGEAIVLLKELSTVRFRESVDVAVNLGIDAKKGDQVVRGATVLPHGTGKSTRVAVFAQGSAAEQARQAGADQVGMEDLAERIRGGVIDFDVLIAAPDAMRMVSPLGQILGPRGLMPNPKVGTVTPDVAQAVRNAKAGQVRYRADKAGIVHCIIGKVDFEPHALQENLQVLLTDLVRAKPATAKGQYLRKLTLSTTMGPGLVIDLATLEY